MVPIPLRTFSKLLVTVLVTFLTGAAAARDRSDAVPPGQEAAGEPTSAVEVDPAFRQAREALADLLVSESIDRIEFEATTYDHGMRRVYLAVDTILELSHGDAEETRLLADHASEVIEALNSHKMPGQLVTFGEGAKTITVRNEGEARMLGELVATTAAVIHEQFGGSAVSYRSKADALFRSVLIDVEEGIPFVQQYLEGMQRIADLPPSQRGRYFK